MTNQKQKLVVVVMSAFTGLAIFVLGFGFGNRNFALRDGVVPQLVSREVGKPSDVDFSLFWDVFQKVEERYAGDAIGRQDLTYGAIRGLVNSLDDPYSLFLTPDERREFFESLNGEFDGIGAEVGEKDHRFVVVAPLDGSPAKAAGLRAGDEIVTVDGANLGDMNLTEVIAKIRGPKGTTVKLGILAEGAEKVRDVTITRDTITVSSVDSALLPDSIGYLRIRQFGKDTARDARKAGQSLLNQGATAIVLDLQSNPGGFLEGAVDVASLWIERGPIVFEEYRDGRRDSFDATGETLLDELPLAVLVDNGSASASEIVAGALQDTGRGRIFGVKTFGKGSVQDVIELKDNSALRLTIAKWLTPKGRALNHDGITPDELVEKPAESDTTEADPVRDRAVEWLKGERR